MAGCDKSAQSATKFCVKHGGGKKCSHAGCIKVARGRTLFCAAVSERGFIPRFNDMHNLCFSHASRFLSIYVSTVEVFAANWKDAVVWPLGSFSFAALTAEVHA